MPATVYIPLSGGTTASYDVETLAPELVKEIFPKVLDATSFTTDFFRQFESRIRAKPKGGDSQTDTQLWTSANGSIVISNRDSAVQGGQKIKVGKRGHYYGEGKRGEQLFTDQYDFEKDQLGEHSFVVDWIRDAHQITRRVDLILGMKNALLDNRAEEMGQWLGRQKQDETLKRLLYDPAAVNNQLVIGGKSIDQLTSSDVITIDFVKQVRAMFAPYGGIPFAYRKTKNGVIHKYAAIAPICAWQGMKNTSDYNLLLENADQRGDGNKLFTGEMPEIDGIIPFELPSINHKEPGRIGTYLDPRAFLGTALTTTTPLASLVLNGGRVANWVTDYPNRQFFAHFPGAPITFIGNQGNRAAGTGNYYALLVNLPSAATDPNKIGLIQYTTDGITLTVSNRLAAANGAAGNTTVGQVTWNAAVNTATHGIGTTLIIPCNAKGVPIVATLFAGSETVYRGTGSVDNEFGVENHEANFLKRSFVGSIFGTGLNKDLAGEVNGYFTLWSAATYAGLPIPVVA
jgi:hypothetical protein